MKRKLLVVLMVVVSLLSGIIIGGCGNLSTQEVQADNTNFDFSYIDYDLYGNGGKKVYLYIDKETGVQYIMNEKGSMCPRYNPDGTLYVGGDN